MVSARLTQPGDNAFTTVASFPESDNTVSDWLYSIALTMFFDATSASCARNGDEPDALNHAYSASWSPFTVMFLGLPVRIKLGTTVVTCMFNFFSSVCIPSDSPTSANLLALYGSKCGTAIFPPIEVMFTILPSPCLLK